MDWIALGLSLKLGLAVVLLLIPFAIMVGYWLACRSFYGKPAVEALLAVPLILPPTVVGYYLLTGLGGQSAIGKWMIEQFGQPLVFHFSGLLIASIIVNIPFAVQPIQRSFEAISQDIRDAAACCGMGFWQRLWRIDLPLAWPGIITAVVLTFAHTMGEFGVVLMVGGNLPGETRTIAISIYDRIQSFDYESAGTMSLWLMVFSVAALALVNSLARKPARFYEQE